MAARKYVYFAQTERFGYNLQAIGFNEEEVRNAMIDEYVKAYKQFNDGIDPTDEDEEDDHEYYKTFLDELYVEKRELNKVEWR